MFHPRCSTFLLVLDGREAIALSNVVVVVGGTAVVVLLNWIPDGDKVCFAFANSSCVAMAQSKKKCVFAAKFPTSSLNQYNDVFMLAVKHYWKTFATVKSRVANFKQHFGINVKIWPWPKINNYFSYW